MMNEWKGLHAHLEFLVLLLVSALGSVLGYISRRWGQGKAIRLSRILFSVISSVFFLFLLRAVASKLGLDYEWTLILVGLCSWMGVEFTAGLLERVVHKLLGVVPIYVKDSNLNQDPHLRPGGVYAACDVAGLAGNQEGVSSSQGNSGQDGVSFGSGGGSCKT